jgi:hypothetical protein
VLIHRSALFHSFNAVFKFGRQGSPIRPTIQGGGPHAIADEMLIRLLANLGNATQAYSWFTERHRYTVAGTKLPGDVVGKSRLVSKAQGPHNSHGDPKGRWIFASFKNRKAVKSCATL